MKRILVTVALLGLSYGAQAARYEFGFQPAYVHLTNKNVLVTTTGIATTTPTTGPFTANYKDLLDDNLKGYNFYLGVLFNEFIGLELHYIKTNNASQVSTITNTASPLPVNGIATHSVTTKDNLTGISLELTPMLPVSGDGSFSFLSSFGIGHYKLDNTTTDNVTGDVYSLGTEQKPSGIGFNMGVGAQYMFNNNLGARLMVRYVKASLNSTLESMLISTIGLNLQF